MRKDGAALMGVLGVAIVAGFFMDWIDLGRWGGITGWEMLKADHTTWYTKLFLGLLPLAGAALAFAGFSGSRATPMIAVGTGVGIIGYLVFQFAWNFIKASGAGLLIVIAAAILAIGAGAATTKKT